jgi:hypothetical protein
MRGWVHFYRGKSQRMGTLPILDGFYYIIEDFFEPKSDVVVTCQKHRSKHLDLNCIYRIFYKIAKKAEPKNEICLSDIRKHNLTVFSQAKDI